MGGIKEENFKEVFEAGARKIAIVTEITLADNIPLKIQKLRQLITKTLTQ